MDDEKTPSSKPSPANRQIEDDPPSQLFRTDSQVDRDLEQGDAEFRDRFRPISSEPATATGAAPSVSTPSDIGNALRNPMVGWPA